MALFGTTLTFHLGLPFSWKLFYYAAVAFAAFSFLYAIRCPRIVRDYDRFRDFIDEGRGGRQILQEALHVFWRPSPFSAPEIQREVVRRFLTSIGHHLADDPNLSPAQLREFDIPQGREADAFWLVRGHADTAHPFARALCAVLTTLGFFLIVIVVYENFRYVWWVTF